MKRIVDGAIALGLLCLCLPVLLVCVVGSAVSLRAWPFFTHSRVGYRGRPFRMVKVRTLPIATSPYAEKYALDGVPTPWFTDLLRRLHLDELPQLWLVVTGRMALVGPRPEMRFLHEQMDPAFAEIRTSVRPGCTGLWQISDRSGALIGECHDFDVYYVRHRSLRLDLWILGRTVLFLVPGLRRPLTLEDLPEPTVVRDLPVLPASAMATSD